MKLVFPLPGVPTIDQQKCGDTISPYIKFYTPSTLEPLFYGAIVGYFSINIFIIKIFRNKNIIN